MLSKTDFKSNKLLVLKAATAVYPSTPILRDLAVVQAVLESALNKEPSQLALKYNNLFGIKGVGTGIVDPIRLTKQTSVTLPTKEFLHGKMQTVDGVFAVNASLEDSFKQHKNLINRDRYKKVITAKTFDEAAEEIWRAGYATDNFYPQKLIKVYNALKAEKIL